jgi:hypothetical protein
MQVCGRAFLGMPFPVLTNHPYVKNLADFIKAAEILSWSLNDFGKHLHLVPVM